MNEKKIEALNEYKAAKEEVTANYNAETWKKFCEAKRNCMLLGVRI